MTDAHYQLDQDVAEFVFGWKEATTTPDATKKENGGTKLLVPHGDTMLPDWDYPRIGVIGRGYHTRRWSSNRDEVLAVVRYVREQPYFFEFLDFLFLKFGLEDQQIPKAGHQFVYRFLLATPQEICEAAIEAAKLFKKVNS